MKTKAFNKWKATTFYGMPLVKTCTIIISKIKRSQLSHQKIKIRNKGKRKILIKIKDPCIHIKKPYQMIPRGNISQAKINTHESSKNKNKNKNNNSQYSLAYAGFGEVQLLVALLLQASPLTKRLISKDLQKHFCENILYLKNFWYKKYNNKS